MYTFQAYQMEAAGYGVQQVLDYLKTNNLSVKKMQGSQINVAVAGDRIEFLKKIASDLGGKYNPTGGSSSVGRTELPSGLKIEAKPAAGGGSGAGADVTKTVESAQCAYLAAAYYGKDFSDESIKRVVSKFDTDESLERILTKLPQDWVDSCIISANLFKTKFANKSYTFHRGSSWVNKLESHWTKLNRAEGEFSNLNKWSPADIYAVSSDGMRIDLTKARTIQELNSMMLKALDSRDIIGISLKKVKGSASIQYKNTDGNRKGYKFKKLSIGLRGFFESGDGYVFFNDGGKIQFRRFGTTWQGEIKGKNANMGKLSGGPIGSIMKRYKVNLKPQRDIVKKTESLYKDFYKFYSHLENRPMKYEDFKIEVDKKDQNWWISKWLTAQLLYYIDTQRDKDGIVTEMIGYAASESQLSGPYIKIS